MNDLPGTVVRSRILGNPGIGMYRDPKVEILHHSVRGLFLYIGPNGRLRLASFLLNKVTVMALESARGCSQWICVLFQWCEI